MAILLLILFILTGFGILGELLAQTFTVIIMFLLFVDILHNYIISLYERHILRIRELRFKQTHYSELRDEILQNQKKSEKTLINHGKDLAKEIISKPEKPKQRIPGHQISER